MLEDFESILATLNGRPPRKYEPIGERDISAGIRKRRVRKTCTLSYLLMCISFGIFSVDYQCRLHQNRFAGESSNSKNESRDE